ncbi:MAG: hypothetical protein QW096_10040 [Thermofilaceae archaeon]
MERTFVSVVPRRGGFDFTRIFQAVASQDGGGLCRVLLFGLPVLLGFEVGAGVGCGFPLCWACRAGADA